MRLSFFSEKFILHDCIVDFIEYKGSNIIFDFKRGVYSRCSNLNNDSLNLTKSCKVIAHIENLEANKASEHISAFIFKKNKRIELEPNKIVNLVNDKTFRIYLDYYSNFANSLLLKGNIGNSELEIMLTEVKDIDICY